MKRCVMNSPFPLGQVGSRKEDVPEKDPWIQTEKNPLKHLDKFSWNTWSAGFSKQSIHHSITSYEGTLYSYEADSPPFNTM